MLIVLGTRHDIEQPMPESLSMSRVSTLTESHVLAAKTLPSADGDVPVDGHKTAETEPSIVDTRIEVDKV